jgi:hypothetical protein
VEDLMDQTQKEARPEGGETDRETQRQGDNRTSDKTIGQVEYADNEGGEEQKQKGGSTPTSTESLQAQKSQIEGPAAYAPHESEVIRATSGDPAKKKTGEF